MFTDDKVRPETVVDYLRRIVRDAKQDNLERAQHAFGRMAEAQLDQQWGQSGETCRQILEEYRQDRVRWQQANDLLESLLGVAGHAH